MSQRFRHVYSSASYLRGRAQLLAPRPPCHEPGCDRPAVVADHDPPLSRHQHLEGAGCCVLRPHCRYHSDAQGARLRNTRAPDRAAAAEAVVEPDGYPADDPVWLLPWIEPFTDVPPEASWPRLMSPPHPRAVGSLGEEFAAFARERMGRELRWWQQLAAVRLLEVDDQDRLVWPAVVLSTARQVGKSVLLRELILWRLAQADRFGQPQLVIHVALDRSIAREVQRDARAWAKERPDEFPKVIDANGYEVIEHANGSRWMIKAAAGAYGHSSSFAAVDEAWGIKAQEIEDGIIPTLTETANPQLLIASTANRKTTSLMIDRRRAALELLDEPGVGDLLLEWSAPPGCDIRDPAMWRMASPHWSEQRERIIRGAVARAVAGDTADGQDPELAVRNQWLDEWREPVRTVSRGQPLLDPGVWADLETSEDSAGSTLTLAVEDWYGQGAAVAVCADQADGGWQLAGWEFDARADALAKALELLDEFAGYRVRLVAGATIVADPDVTELKVASVTPGTSTLARAGLALLRELAGEDRVTWDPRDGYELARAVDRARVVERQTGLVLVGDRHDLIKAACWALLKQATAAPVPAIH
jgi:hypothetical protein